MTSVGLKTKEEADAEPREGCGCRRTWLAQAREKKLGLCQTLHCKSFLRLGWTFHDGRDFHSWSSLHSPGTEWMLSTNMLTEGTKSPFWAQHPRLSFGEPPSCTLYSQAMNEGSPHPLHRGPLLRLGSPHIQDHWLHLGRWYPHKGLKSLPLKLESWHKRKGLLPRERGTLPN